MAGDDKLAGHAGQSALDSFWIAAAGGVSAGVAASVLTCPLDVVKTRMQVQAGAGETRAYRGPVQALRKIVAEEGARGIFRGLWPTTVGLTANWALYFGAYNQLQHWLGDTAYATRRGSPLNHLIAAIGAGAVTATVTSPLWVVKTRFQTHSMPRPTHGESAARYRGVTALLLRIAEREGVRALFKGWGVSMLGLIHVAIQFPLYERFKLMLAAPDESVTVPRLVAATVGSKIVASSVSYPLEVVRSRQQHATATLHARDAALSIWKVERFRGFYSGMTTNLLRVIPTTVITFTTYELVVSAIGRAVKRDDLA